MKTLFKILLAIVVLGGIYFFLMYKNLVPSFDFFKSKEIQLRETPLILEDVKDIAELFTATAYEEVMIDRTKKVKNSAMSQIVSFKKYTSHRFVLLARGTCMAGTDLSGLKKEDIIAQDSSITIKIHKAKIITTIINPSDYDIYIDEGEWSPKEVTLLKSYATNKIKHLAIEDGILKKAQERTDLLLKQFFKSIGFVNVTIETR